MSAANTGGPAFPWNSEQEVPGMTLRDYFAAKAMHAFIGLGGEIDVEEFYDIASDAYLLADAMLNARKA